VKLVVAHAGARRQLLERALGKPQNGSQDVVEVVRHASSEPPHGLELLGVPEAVLELGLLFPRLSLLGHVDGGENDSPPFVFVTRCHGPAHHHPAAPSIERAVPALHRRHPPALGELNELLGEVVHRLGHEDLVEVGQQLALIAGLEHLAGGAVHVEHPNRAGAGLGDLGVRLEVRTQLTHSVAPQPVDDGPGLREVFFPHAHGHLLEQLAVAPLPLLEQRLGRLPRGDVANRHQEQSVADG
jgi:hypothetical protein